MNENPGTELSEKERSRSKRSAIASECFGGIASTMINDSAVIILFVSMLELGSTFTMLTTSFRGIASCLLQIPCAYLAIRFGCKRMIRTSAMISCLMFLLLAASPWFGHASKYIAMFAAIVFCLSLPLYVSAWFPLIDGFLRREERGSFLGLNRFLWMTTACLFIFFSGLLLGKKPGIWELQAIIALTGLLCLGRYFFIGRIETQPTTSEVQGFRSSFRTAVTNAPLCGFSIYLFCLYLASYSTLPLGFMYLKTHMPVGDNILVIISSVTMLGTLSGYLSAGKMLRHFGAKKMLLALHLLFALVNFALFVCGPKYPHAVPLITVLLTGYGFLTAASSVVTSSEMMALARPGNKAMAMALCGSFLSAGMGLSRFFSSLLLGGGILAPFWSWKNIPFTNYQSLFLFSGIIVLIVCLMLILVPAIIPERDYYYEPH
ncbi:MAG: Major Facilitator Superfamily protein [Lentisphaerae bacterium ADurb.Bin242]|nr:MAG: Major Facilitator Superfamily protein [Lentisphaerae bacterium ADurb.Bin242]